MTTSPCCERCRSTHEAYEGKDNPNLGTMRTAPCICPCHTAEQEKPEAHQTGYFEMRPRSELRFDEPKDAPASPLTPFGEYMEKALAKDWGGLARAFAEGDIQWHTKEWEVFVTKIHGEGYEQGRKAERERIGTIKDILEFNVPRNPSDASIIRITNDIWANAIKPRLLELLSTPTNEEERK